MRTLPQIKIKNFNDLRLIRLTTLRNAFALEILNLMVVVLQTNDWDSTMSRDSSQKSMGVHSSNKG